jgi:hypothetical protein
VGALLALREEACAAAYMAGQPWADAQRDAIRLLRTWHEDVFTASYDDVVARMGQMEKEE